jgi:hypothetical protein
LAVPAAARPRRRARAANVSNPQYCRALIRAPDQLMLVAPNTWRRVVA